MVLSLTEAEDCGAARLKVTERGPEFHRSIFVGTASSITPVTKPSKIPATIAALAYSTQGRRMQHADETLRW